MLKDVESEDAIKTSIPERQLMRVADDIGVFENLVLEFDASWVFLRGRTRTDVKDYAVAFAQKLLEISPDWVGHVVGRNGDYLFLDEKRHVVLDSIGGATGFALKPSSAGTQFAVAGGTTDNIGNALIHSIKPAGLHHRLMSIRPYGFSLRYVPCFTSGYANANFLRRRLDVLMNIFDHKPLGRIECPIFALRFAKVIPSAARDLSVARMLTHLEGDRIE